MRRHKKSRATNSATLETTENTREAMSRDDLYDVVENVTEEAKNGACTEQKETNEKNESEALKTTEEVEERDSIVFFDLCEDLDVKLTRTDKLDGYTQSVFNACTRKMKHSIFILGEEGAGKKTVIEYLAYRIATGRCPKLFSEHKTTFYIVNMDTIAKDKKCFVSNVNYMLTFAKSEGVENLIIYLDNIVMGLDLFKGLYDEIMEELDIDSFMNFKFIATFDDGQLMTEEEEVNLAEFVKKYCVAVKVESEDKPKKILRVLKFRIEELEDIHGVTIPSNVLETLLMCYYGRNFTDYFNYKKFLEDVDAFLAMVEVSGKKTASSGDIRKYYRKSFVLMDELPTGYNEVTAIHESGHILLELTISKLYTLYGASILYDAKSGIEAITMVKRTQYMSYNEEDMINYIAMVLAGRAAELEYCVDKKTYGVLAHRRLNINKGSSDDVKSATEELREWVVRNGAYKFTGFHVSNMDYEDLSSIEQYKVDFIVRWLLGRAYKKSEYMVKENKAFIMTMKNFLLRNITATREDILEIARRTIKG